MRSSTSHSAAGYTLLEIVVVVLLVMLTLAVATRSYRGYQERAAARGAAQIFARDLSLAHQTALRVRIPVVIRFDEPGQSYIVRTEAGVDLTSRSFGPGADMELTAIDLEFPGDSVRFTRRGLVDLSGVSESIGRARFVAGTREFAVSFNGMGISRVEEL